MKIARISRCLSVPALPVLLLPVLVSCTGTMNSELVVGDPLRADRQYAPPSVHESAQGEHRDDLGAAEPSISSLDRTGWSPTRVHVPSDVPMHQPRYTDDWTFDTTSTRNRGRYPTASSALDNPTSKGGDLQIKEAVLAPVAAGADIAQMPVRMIAARPWQRTRTGTDSYQRYPQPRTETPDGLVPIENEASHAAPPSGQQPEAKQPLPGAALPWPTSPESGAAAEVRPTQLRPTQLRPTQIRPTQPPNPPAAPGTAEEDQPQWNRPPVASDEHATEHEKNAEHEKKKDQP